MTAKPCLRTRDDFESAILAPIRDVVGPGGLITDDAGIQPYMESWRDGWVGRSPFVVRPGSTGELAEVMRIAARTGMPIVPQGGNTGLTGAGQPHDDGSEIVVSTARMNRIRDIDLDNDTITVEAGCVLSRIQEEARKANRLFPLSLGAEGTCQIGGNISTNAGGVQVLRYGNMRAQVLGLEVVLADGTIWNGLRGLRKDNAGYDMKQIFIGSEGTLGFITAAVLKLSPLPSATATALLAVQSPARAISLLNRTKALAGDSITTFELMQRVCLDVAQQYVPDVPEPMAERHPWYVLLEIADKSSNQNLHGIMERLFTDALEADELLDGVLATSEAQAGGLWRIREGIAEGQRQAGVSYKHDVSVPISKVPEFIDRVSTALTERFPGIRPFSFGHLGDGNIHFNPVQPEGAEPDVWRGYLEEVNRITHDLVFDLGGSISAEHGIGRLRLHELPRYKSGVELRMMRSLKQVFDPQNILNPGKILFPDPAAEESDRV